MLPESIPHFGIGPFFGFAINVGMSLLCLVILIYYRKYSPLKWLLFFYLGSAFYFGGWFLYALQSSTFTILFGYKVLHAALTILPLNWAFFMITLTREKTDIRSWIIIIISLLLAILTLASNDVRFFGLPLVAHPVIQNVMRPQSLYLRSIIYVFCLIVCLYYLIILSAKFFKLKTEKPVYLLPFGIGLFFWFLGGVNDALLTYGYVFISSDKILWLTSFGLSIFLTITVVFHFRSMEIIAHKKIVKSKQELEQEIEHRKRVEIELNKYKQQLELKVKQQTLELENNRKAMADLKGDIKRGHRFGRIIGKSESMQAIYALIKDVSDVFVTVLITGESGTGKELVAEAIHKSGWRKEHPFVKVNCSALSEGVLESELFGHVKGAFTGADADKIGRFQKAANGTILLDEIGDVSLNFQSRLLRILQEREFECVGDATTQVMKARVLASTNQDLMDKVEKKTFREDLYYRLKVVEIKLPPLRKRKEDIPLLIHHFIDTFNEELGKKIDKLSSDVLRIFMAYHWPGNVRELKNLLEHICILCKEKTIDEDDLPSDFLSNVLSDDQLSEAVSEKFSRILPKGKQTKSDKDDLIMALEQAQWNKTRAAEILGISRRTLYRRLKIYKL